MHAWLSENGKNVLFVSCSDCRDATKFVAALKVANRPALEAKCELRVFINLSERPVPSVFRKAAHLEERELVFGGPIKGRARPFPDFSITG